MGRPRLQIGTHGRIRVETLGPKRFRARCRYRDFNGKVYDVERIGTSKANAEDRVKAAIRDWVTPVEGSMITASTRVSEVARLWLAQFEIEADHGLRSFGSLDTYRNRLDKIVLPEIGELAISEVSTPTLDRLCKGVRDASSASSAKTVRSILSGMCDLAVSHGALERNPARAVGKLESKKAANTPKRSRSLTADEVLDLLAKLDADERALADDLPDLARFFLGTGQRTGEALCAHWSDFDESKKVIVMSGNVIRARGRGRIINRGKTENAVRPIPLADWCVAMLLNRRALADNLAGPIFPSTTGTIREATNVRNRAWKPFVKRAGYEWITFRTFRKTVATLLDEAGLTARQIADVLGHSRPSMTQDVYMGRGAPSRAAADALNQAIDRGK